MKKNTPIAQLLREKRKARILKESPTRLVEEIKDVLIQALRKVGEDIHGSEVEGTKENFTVSLTFKNDKQVEYNFKIDDTGELILTGQDGDNVELGEIGFLPSGEPRFNATFIQSNMQDYFENNLTPNNDEDFSFNDEEEFEEPEEEKLSDPLDFLKENKLNVVRELLEEAFYEVLIERLGSDILIPAGKEILSRYPQTKKALAAFFGPEYPTFVRDVQYVAYKPTTFKIILSNSTNFFIEWSGNGFLVNTPGKKLDISKVDDYQRAQNYINDLLKTGPIQSTADMEAEQEPTPEDDLFSPPGGGAGGMSPDTGMSPDMGMGGEDFPPPEGEEGLEEPETPETEPDIEFDIT